MTAPSNVYYERLIYNVIKAQLITNPKRSFKAFFCVCSSIHGSNGKNTRFESKFENR